MNVLALLRRMVRNWFDPIPQDPNTVMLGLHRGYLVEMVPVQRDGRIVAWVPDRDATETIDNAIAAGEAEDMDAVPAPSTPAAYLSPGKPPALPPPLPPQPPQPAFNPSGIPGI